MVPAYSDSPYRPSTHLPMTPAEQFLLESINRARLDPLGEARRFGIDLNQGLTPGKLDGNARQPLASNSLLNEAAAQHSLWMLENDIFSHTGAQGSTAGDRMKKAGYVFEGSWSWGENISWSGSTGTISLDTEIGKQHHSLFLSPGHRVNMLEGFFGEAGVAQEAGPFTDGLTYNASMVTENFARSGDKLFLTGVIYSDSDTDNFYSIGEGVGGTGIRTAAASTNSTLAGGYALALDPSPAIEARFVRSSAPEIVFKVDLSTANAKVDLVDGIRLESSAHLTLISGATVATLLGTGSLNLTGSDTADRLTGNKGANKITGGLGNDTIDGAAGADSMAGGAGNDTYHVRDRGDVVVETASGGVDIVHSHLPSYTLHAQVEQAWIMNTQAASLTGNELSNFIHAGKGDNLIHGGGGNDTVSYLEAVDGSKGVVVSLALGTAQATVGSGLDTLISIEHLHGSNLADKLTGDGGVNTLYGYNGNDSLDGGSGHDRMIGGKGDDAYHLRDGGDTAVEFAGEGTDTVYSYIGDVTLPSHVENARIMSTGTASITGNPLANVLYAGKGNNLLDGGSGTDTLSYAYGANGTQGVKVSLATTTAQATNGSGTDTISGFERLTGSPNSDSLTGNGAANLIRGGNGNDKLSGGSGADTLYGDAGNDLLRGGSGKDVLYGGSGKDLFRFDSTPDSTTNVDRIMDFSVADDTIQLENAIFTRFGKSTTGPIPQASFKDNTSGLATDADDYLVYETDTGKLFYDANGNGAGGAVQIALLGVNLSLTTADFVLV